MTNKKILSIIVGIALLMIGFRGGVDSIKPIVGGLVHNTKEIFSAGITLEDNLAISSGGITATGNTALTGNLTVSGDVGLGDAIADTITLNSPVTSSLAMTTATSVNQLIATTTVTSGEFQALQARGRSIATSGSTAEVRGIYARATTNDALYGGTVTALQTETIAKGTSTTVNLRGIFVAVDSENTPTAITNLYGGYIRTKTTVAPATDFYGLVIENETFGSGIAADAAILLKGTATAGFDYGIDMNGVTINTAEIRVASGAAILSGSGAPSSSGGASNKCNIGGGTDFSIGSLYLRSDGSTDSTLYVCTATDTWSASDNSPD